MTLVRRAATVHGRVQGVSFRYYTHVEANRRGLTGWIRNAEDGTVRLEVQGPDAAITSFVRWLRTGPSHAVVDHVDIIEIDPIPGEDAFHVTR